MRIIPRLALLGAVLAAGLAAAPAAEADGWRDRGWHRGHDRHWDRGWHRGHDRHWDRRHWDRGRVHHHHHRRHRDDAWDTNSLALGAIVGLGAGVVLGTVLAPPPAGVPR